MIGSFPYHNLSRKVKPRMTMVDITQKPEVYREATARGIIKLRPETIRRIREGKIEKGDPFEIARIAGILAAKNTSGLIPLCHPLPITNVKVEIGIENEELVSVTTTVKTKAQTGVEMEALVGTAVALLTIWDMTKAYEKDSEGQYPFTAIKEIKVLRKLKEESKNE